MTAQQKVRNELNREYFALAFCQNNDQRKMVEASIDVLEEELNGYILDLVDLLSQ